MKRLVAMAHFSRAREKIRLEESHIQARRFIVYYPFTLPGTVLAFLALVLLARSLRIQNPYGFVIAGFAITTLIVLSVAGRLQANRFNSVPVQWDSSTPLVAGVAGNSQHLHSDGIIPLWFYRLHFFISGRVQVGRDAFFSIFQEASSQGGDRLSMPLYIPFSGELHARGMLSIRDIFGLTRARFGEEMRRTILVQPGPFSGVDSSLIEAIGGFEDKSRQSALEEERYYMREYMPGDRFRDINWKSSSRLAQLITRISPHTQEKKKLVCVDFRNHTYASRDTLGAVAQLDQLKSWLCAFLRRMKHDNPDYEFLIKTGTEVFRLNQPEEIDEFALYLSCLFFQHEPSEGENLPDAQEVFIFTTGLDDHLPLALQRYGKAVVRVFRTVKSRKAEGKGVQVQIFPSARTISIPGAWIFNKYRNQAFMKTDAVAGTKMEEHPVEVRLFS
jgi:hypothetical protein